MAKKKRKKKSARLDADQQPQELTGVMRLLVEIPAAKLDLHGLTALQAEARLRDFMRTESTRSAGQVVHIVTGRGTRSQGAAVLPGIAQDLLRGDLADFVKEMAGLPGGGALAVRLR